MQGNAGMLTITNDHLSTDWTETSEKRKDMSASATSLQLVPVGSGKRKIETNYQQLSQRFRTSLFLTIYVSPNQYRSKSIVSP